MNKHNHSDAVQLAQKTHDYDLESSQEFCE